MIVVVAKELTNARVMFSHVQQAAVTAALITAPGIFTVALRALACHLLFAFIHIYVKGKIKRLQYGRLYRGGSFKGNMSRHEHLSPQQKRKQLYSIK